MPVRVFSHYKQVFLEQSLRQPFEVVLDQKAPIVFSFQHGRDQTLPLQFERFFFFFLMVKVEGRSCNLILS